MKKIFMKTTLNKKQSFNIVQNSFLHQFYYLFFIITTKKQSDNISQQYQTVYIINQ